MEARGRKQTPRLPGRDNRVRENQSSGGSNAEIRRGFQMGVIRPGEQAIACDLPWAQF